MSSGGQGGPLRYHLRVHPDVTDAIKKQPPAIRLAVLEVVKELLVHPRSRSLGVTQVKGISHPGVHTAPIAEYGYLEFEIYADYPTVHIFRIVFWEPLT